MLVTGKLVGHLPLINCCSYATVNYVFAELPQVTLPSINLVCTLFSKESNVTHIILSNYLNNIKFYVIC